MQEICDSDLDNKQEFLIAPYFFLTRIVFT